MRFSTQLFHNLFIMSRKFVIAFKTISIVTSINIIGVAQTCTETYTFQNPEHFSGNQGEVGAIYKFPNVYLGVDAYIKIIGISDAKLHEVDQNWTGFDKAWQPVVEGFNTGGYVDWEISFTKAGSLTPIKICAPITAIDIDGETDYQEYIETKDYSSYGIIASGVTNLTIFNPADGYSIKAQGVNWSYSGIDTTKQDVMIQFNFIDVEKFYYRTGVTSNSIGEGRLFSLHFSAYLEPTCKDVVSAGSIGDSQNNCGAFTPKTLKNLTPASGGSGVLQYQWFRNNINAPVNDPTWTLITGATNDTYSPPSTSKTTYYFRKAKRDGCATFDATSNGVAISIYNAVSATISAGSDITQTEKANFIMNAQTPKTGEIGTWSVVSGEAYISELNNRFSIITVPAGKEAVLRWTISNPGCSVSDDVKLTNLKSSSSKGCINSINPNGDLELSGTVSTYETNIEGSPASFINTSERPEGWADGYGSGVNASNYLGAFYINNPKIGISNSGIRNVYIRGKDNCISSVITKGKIECGVTYNVSAYIAAWTISAAQNNAPFKIEFVFQDSNKTLPQRVIEYKMVAPKSGGYNNLNWQRYEFEVTFTQSDYEIFGLYITSDDNVNGIMIDDVCINSDASGVISNAGNTQVQCGNGTFKLAANIPTLGTGTWSIVSGSGVIQAPNNPESQITGVNSGSTTTLLWSINNGTCGISESNVVLINNATPSVSITPEANEICLGTISTINSFVSGGAAPFLFQWESSSDSLNWSIIAGENSANLNLNTTAPSVKYYRLVVTSSGNCDKITSAGVKITVASFEGCECILQSCSNYSKLVFNNSEKIEDKPGLIGDKWRFKNILTGFDAIVEVTNAVNADSLRSIDNTSVNVDDWCPEIYIDFLNGKDSYLDWKISIVQAGTNNPANLPSSSRVTSYDVDGNNSYREIHGHVNSNGFIVNDPTELNILNEPPFALVLGSTNEYVSISTDPKVKATFYYPGQNNVFSIRLGVRTTNATGSAFRQFAVSFDPCISYSKPDINPQKPEIAGLKETCIDNENSTYTTTQPFTSYSWSVVGGVIISGKDSSTVKIKWTTKGKGIVSVTTIDANGCIGNTSYDVLVVKQPILSLDVNNKTICSGQSVELNANINGGTGSFSYTWSKSIDSISFSPMPSSTKTLTINGLTQTTYYKVLIDATATGCGTLVAQAKITVVNLPTANAGSDKTQCSDIFSMNANASSTGIGKWSVINGNVTIDDINSPTAKVKLNSSTATLRWTITINSTCDASDDILLSISTPLSITSNLSNMSECVGGKQALSVTVSNSAGTITYQWQSSQDSIVWNNISGQTSASFTPPSTSSDTIFYRVIINSSISGCGTGIESKVAKVQILPKPKIKVTANNTTVCNGASVTLSAKIEGGVDCSIQWQNSTDNGTNWNDISGANGNTLGISAMNQTTRYRTTLVCTGNGCCN
jgi:hypothetical protein